MIFFTTELKGLPYLANFLYSQYKKRGKFWALAQFLRIAEATMTEESVGIELEEGGGPEEGPAAIQQESNREEGEELQTTQPGGGG